MPIRRVVIDHLVVGVADLARSRAFYARALAPLGFVDLGDGGDGRSVAFGPVGLDDFIISLDYPVGGSIHVAFAAETQEQVDEFYVAAIAAGARDNGPPGIRPEYSMGYYGAFVLDPDGNNVEAVHHATQPGEPAAATPRPRPGLIRACPRAGGALGSVGALPRGSPS
jgi:catechol 2,3-dioxygenase-like lactoylglutathione lyase family enzyme